MHQLRKSRVPAERVKVGVRLEELKDNGLLLISLLERGKGFFVLAETQIGVHESAGGNIPVFPAFLQFCQEPTGIATTAGVGIGSDQNADYARTAVGSREGLLQRTEPLSGWVWPAPRGHVDHSSLKKKHARGVPAG